MKNLEDEYKRFLQEETPDLWNRIEAGLTDKKAKPKKNIFTFKYASVCAAAVLFAILLSGLYFAGMRGRNQAADTAPQNNMMSDNNKMPEAAGGSVTGSAAENNDVQYAMDSSAQNDGQNGEEIAADGQCESETSERSEASGSITQDADDAAAEENINEMEPSTDNVLPQETEKTATPLSGKMEVTDTEQKDGRTVYYLRTEDGQTVSAVSGEGVETVLQIGETYLFTLKASEEQDWEYVIETAE